MHLASVHECVSRLDYFFGTDSVVSLLAGSDIHQVAISHHSPITVTLFETVTKPEAIMWQFLIYLTQDIPFIAMPKSTWDEYVTLNAQHTSNPNLL